MLQLITYRLVISMPRNKPRWQRRKQARPGEILAAALDLFRARGYAATRIEDVAKRAGVTKGTVYLYFPSKEALFKALVRESVLPNIQRAEQMVRGHRGSPSDLLRDLLIMIGGRIAADDRLSAFPKLMIAEAGNFPELARFYLRQVIRRGLRLIAFILARGVAAGEFAPMDYAATARLAIAPILFLALWRHSFAAHDAKGPTAQAIVARHVEVFIGGIAAGPRR
jgi:AcrR family transcriptional regulator